MHRRGRRHRILIAAGVGCALVAAACSSTKSSDGSSRPTRPDFAAVAAEVDRFVRSNGLNGAGLVLVDKEKGQIWEHYAGEFGPKRVSLIASASKMITAGVLLRLADEGKLDLDAPVAKVAPWGAAHPAITVSQLLSNSSGLEGLTDQLYPPYVCQYLPTGTIQQCAETIFGTPYDDAEVIPPDTKFRYGGAQWQVAGAVAEVASGESWAQLIDETYATPCGVTSLGYNNHYSQIVNPDGPFVYPPQFDDSPSVLPATDNPNMEGGAYINPVDYGKLLLMHLRGGTCDGGRVLSTKAVELAHRDRIGEVYDGSTGSTGLEGYGLGWWVDRKNPRFVEDAGAFGAVPWLDMRRGYGAYLVVERKFDDGIALAKRIRPLIDREIDRTK